MTRMCLVLATAVVIVSWLAGARAKADLIQWSATAGPTGPNYNPSNGTAGINSLNYGSNAETQLLGTNATTNGSSSGSVVLAILGAYFNLPSQDEARFGGSTGNYSLSLTLHDLASGASGSLTFQGNFSGTIVPGVVDLTNTYMGPTTQTLTLGRNLYTVTIGSFVSPDITGPPPFVGRPGSISASISVQPVTSSAPEPSSLVLACLGLPLFGLARWVRRRRQTADNVASQA
jgi:hypothetical protein